jgi:hypothetical protein
MLNAECGMSGAMRNAEIIPHSAFSIPHFLSSAQIQCLASFARDVLAELLPRFQAG